MMGWLCGSCTVCSEVSVREVADQAVVILQWKSWPNTRFGQLKLSEEKASAMVAIGRGTNALSLVGIPAGKRLSCLTEETRQVSPHNAQLLTPTLWRLVAGMPDAASSSVDTTCRQLGGYDRGQ